MRAGGQAGVPPPALSSVAETLRRVGVRIKDYRWIVRTQARATRLDDASAWGHGPDVPVLLLPGVYETWAVMESLARALHEAGHPVHTVPALGFNAGPLAGSAHLVVKRILELGLDRVVLVAHSKGGLVGKGVLGDSSVAHRVAGLVTVNTPFGGSALAYVFPTRAVLALRPSAEMVRALSTRVDVHGKIASLSAPFDPHVPGGGELPGAVNIHLPVDGHFRPLGDHRVHAMVLEQVARLARSPRGGPDAS